MNIFFTAFIGAWISEYYIGIGCLMAWTFIFTFIFERIKKTRIGGEYLKKVDPRIYKLIGIGVSVLAVLCTYLSKRTMPPQVEIMVMLVVLMYLFQKLVALKLLKKVIEIADVKKEERQEVRKHKKAINEETKRRVKEEMLNKQG